MVPWVPSESAPTKATGFVYAVADSCNEAPVGRSLVRTPPTGASLYLTGRYAASIKPHQHLFPSVHATTDGRFTILKPSGFAFNPTGPRNRDSVCRNFTWSASANVVCVLNRIRWTQVGVPGVYALLVGCTVVLVQMNKNSTTSAVIVECASGGLVKAAGFCRCGHRRYGSGDTDRGYGCDSSQQADNTHFSSLLESRFGRQMQRIRPLMRDARCRG